ncbi:MAG: hypothetical protein N3A54_05245 [Patescibacteria group bacterium]|nr:hypothetical protein [Patescibacteria group bacterium]
MKSKISSSRELIERYVLIFVGILLINIGLLYFLQTQVNVITLLKQEKIQLEQDQKIINASEEIYATYKDHIEEIFSVFPSEGEVLTFLQTLESVSKKYGANVIARFASSSPQSEGDRLFLLFRLNLQTTRQNFGQLLKALENLPYMMRLISLTMNSSDGFKDELYVTIHLKLYVKNPFSN